MTTKSGKVVILDFVFCPRSEAEFGVSLGSVLDLVLLLIVLITLLLRVINQYARGSCRLCHPKCFHTKKCGPPAMSEDVLVPSADD